MEKAILNISETLIQKEIHFYISEPSRIYKTESGKRLQIISPGRINVHAGPDLMDIAVLLNGYLIIGDAEIHKKSSDWINHKHDDDVAYKNVILHIVLEIDTTIENKFETLVLDYSSLSNKILKLESKSPESVFSAEELQNFALHRLLRKTSEASKLLIENSLKITLSMMTSSYIDRYEKKRNRHKYDPDRLAKLVEDILNSYAMEFLESLQSNDQIDVQEALLRLVKKTLTGEGAHLRRELLINSILPIALAIADDEARINLFVWYWSIPCLNQYGMLKRKFPDLPQNFLWQQQGMLEYIREFGSRNNVASEALKEYGFAEILSFYKLGRLPLDIESN
ncbi:MAG: DUF2851 family protein [Candidatus Kapabacteria bacterium]|nr:DUF2851 family protein [Ignavibacteriota bacterium]MCW5884515.1 DUF2851 family protein [Candidatus Kapabacteria bacterium]